MSKTKYLLNTGILVCFIFHTQFGKALELNDNKSAKLVPENYPEAKYCSLYLCFDDTLEPLGQCADKVRPVTEERPSFAAGLSGKALETGKTGIKFQVALPEIPRYALSFWMSPVDWKGSEEAARKFVTIKTDYGMIDLGKNKGKQTAHDINAPLHGMGYLAVKVNNPARAYQDMWYLDAWDPMHWNDPKWIGSFDMNRLPKKEWVPGDWHQIVINVDQPRRQVDLFVDGAYLCRDSNVRLGKGISEIIFNGNPEGKTLYDNVIVYPYPFSVREVRSLYEARPKALFPMPQSLSLQPEVYTRFTYLDQKLWVGIDAREAADKTVFSLGAESKTIAPGAGGFFETMFDTSKLPLGKYNVKAALFKGATKESEKEAVFDKDDNTTWETAAALGTEEKVLRPWSPLKICDKHIIACWGREYVFNTTNNVIEQIISQGEKILASPMRFDVSLPNERQAVEWIPRTFTITKETPAVIIIDCSYAGHVAAQTNQFLTLDLQYRFEYDGAIFIDAKLTPLAPPLDIDKFSVIIPFRNEFARYLNYNNEVYRKEKELNIPFMAYYGGVFSSKADNKTIDWLLSSKGSVLKREMFFLPWLYIGNDNIGICYVAEEMRNWATDDEHESCMIEMEGSPDIPMTLYLNLIQRSKAFPLEKTLNWTFALQATPVKPLYPDNVRDWRFDKYTDNPFQRPGAYSHPNPNMVETWYSRWGLGLGNRTRNKSDMKRVVDNFHKKGMKYYGHAVMTWSSEIEPETFEYQDEMRKVPLKGEYHRLYEYCLSTFRNDQDFVGTEYLRREKDSPDDTPYSYDGYYWVGTCQGSKRMQDYLAWCYKYLLEQCGWDGVHFDVGDVYPCVSEKHGCGYIDINGKLRPTWPILGERAILKRILAVFQEHGVEPVISVALMPRCTISAGFANDIQTGEWWMKAAAEGHYYLDLLNLEDFRIFISPRQTGIPATLLLEDGRGARTKEQQMAPAREYVMLSMLHDLNMFSKKNLTPINEAMTVKYNHGMADTDFLPYWNVMENGVNVSEPDSIKVSLYPKQSRDKVLIVAGNVAKIPLKSNVSIDMKKLGFKTKGIIKNAYTGEIIADKPEFNIEIPPGTSMLFLVE